MASAHPDPTISLPFQLKTALVLGGSPLPIVFFAHWLMHPEFRRYRLGINPDAGRDAHGPVAFADLL